jgi:hypothetical protein
MSPSARYEQEESDSKTDQHVVTPCRCLHQLWPLVSNVTWTIRLQQRLGLRHYSYCQNGPGRRKLVRLREPRNQGPVARNEKEIPRDLWGKIRCGYADAVMPVR